MSTETPDPTPQPEEWRLDLEDRLPKDPIIWSADDELDGWKDDPWTYAKWARVAGHGPMANGKGCERCGYDTSMCMFSAFHDAMLTTTIRELDKIGVLASPVPQVREDGLPDGFSARDFAIAVGALMRDAQEAILADMLGGLDPNDEWRRMARNAAKAAVKMAVQRGWRPTQ